MSKNNSKKESNVKNKPQEQGEGKSGGFVGLLKDIIKALFNSVVDLPQQEQCKNYNQQEGKDMSTETTVKQRGKKNPEDLDQKQLEEAAKGLKERLQKSGAGNQPVGIEVPSQATTQDVDDVKAMER
ncbi:hypothetical protein GO685_00790 [Wolbachia endosymbiont of Madathamugadia hiepei]|uniref:hypothetical protein n=1 Tax=Wolbachia endosymbiont of Madathamugadia hiepei TaxID=1241303 RepID=UPI00158E540F|nr:hypothetical protein [Wolbachia endosymbiont of Madathamugadia hiepei]NUX01064.1 hypothetical protein [Wolbachia endosymbiont of Madathamugadia hiepei]